MNEKAIREAERKHRELDAQDWARSQRAKRLAWERRWSYPGKACVEHPRYGSVIVPHGSNLSALQNAAEYWGCDVSEITDRARVWACDQSLPAVRPPDHGGAAAESWGAMLERLMREQEQKKSAEEAAKAARHEEKKRKEAERRESHCSQIELFDA